MARLWAPLALPWWMWTLMCRKLASFAIGKLKQFDYTTNKACTDNTGYLLMCAQM